MEGFGHSALVTVGDELLAGRVVDTNAAWLSKELRNLGFSCVHRETVRDEIEEIASSVDRALERAAVVIVMGGLGPTGDDVTRDGIARAIGVDLVEHQAALQSIRGLFEERGRTMPERDACQALLPEGAGFLRNTLGTAPGVVVEHLGRLVFALPGVPRELEELFRREIAPILEVHPLRGQGLVARELTLSGIPESQVGERLGDLLKPGRNPSIGSYPRVADVVLAVEARSEDPHEAERLVEEDLKLLEGMLEGFVLRRGRWTLDAVVAERLLETKTSLAVAESLTGGMIAERLIGHPGISEVFLAGLVTYANSAKVELLGVRPETLETVGAVSEECAIEMARGARKAAGAAVGLSTTGIAGPGGATPGKPVGTVWIGYSSETEESALRLQLIGDREQIRERSTHRALDLLWRKL